MGRRSKADLLGLVERIIGMYENDKMIIQDIEATLRDDGYDISREAIRRSLKTSKSVAAQYKKAATEAKVLIDTVRDNPNTDVVEITTNLLAKQLFDFVQSVDELNFENAGDLMLAINRLSSAQVRISKQRLTYQNGYNQAKKEILNSLQKELSQYPEILTKLTIIVTRMETKEK